MSRRTGAGHEPQRDPPEFSEPGSARRRQLARHVVLDRSLESLPLFRLSDSADDSATSYQTPDGNRWRVLPYPADRLPGTFDQDVYVEIFRRYTDAGFPPDGVVSFTLHSFLRSIGRRADGRTYEQLRTALTRLERTVLESSGVYYDATRQQRVHSSFSVLGSVAIERRRLLDQSQYHLFGTFTSAEPGIARAVISPLIRGNIISGHCTRLSVATYSSLHSAVARRLYRLIEAARIEHRETWNVTSQDLAQLLPLAQRYPSHLLRVLHPAHEMLVTAGLLHSAHIRQVGEGWMLEYVLRQHDS